MREPVEVLKLYTSSRLKNKKMVLATVVDVQGSAYRRPGAHLLFTSDGKRAGNISAGCLENDILARGEEVFDLCAPLLLTYSSDEFFGLNYGCDGTIKVLVQPLKNRQSEYPLAFELAQKGGEVLGLATIYESCEKSLIGKQILLAQGAVVHSEVESDIVQSICDQINGAQENLQIVSGATSVFYEVIKPGARLVIFGAGDDAQPLLDMANLLGFVPSLVDSRRSYLERYNHSTETHPYDKDFDAGSVLGSSGNTAVLIMSHNFELDKLFLQCALDSNCAYIGLMGSRKRTLKLLEELGLEAPPAQLRFPVGLDLGAETAEEIALSILSEVLAFWRGASAAPLTALTGPIHQRDDSSATESNLTDQIPIAIKASVCGGPFA